MVKTFILTNIVRKLGKRFCLHKSYEVKFNIYISIIQVINKSKTIPNVCIKLIRLIFDKENIHIFS